MKDYTAPNTVAHPRLHEPGARRASRVGARAVAPRAAPGFARRCALHLPPEGIGLQRSWPPASRNSASAWWPTYPKTPSRRRTTPSPHSGGAPAYGPGDGPRAGHPQCRGAIDPRSPARGTRPRPARARCCNRIVQGVESRRRSTRSSSASTSPFGYPWTNAETSPACSPRRSRSRAAKTVPLGSFVNLSEERPVREIVRRDQRRQITISGEAVGRSRSTLWTDVSALLAGPGPARRRGLRRGRRAGGDQQLASATSAGPCCCRPCWST